MFKVNNKNANNVYSGTVIGKFEQIQYSNLFLLIVPGFICSNSTKETLVWNMFNVNNKDIDVNEVTLVSLLLTLNIIHILLWCFFLLNLNK